MWLGYFVVYFVLCVVQKIRIPVPGRNPTSGLLWQRGSFLPIEQRARFVAVLVSAVSGSSRKGIVFAAGLTAGVPSGNAPVGMRFCELPEACRGGGFRGFGRDKLKVW